MTLEPSWLRRFLEHAEFADAVSFSTLCAYRSHVRRFLDYANQDGHSKLAAPMLGQAYLAELRARGLRNTTIQGHLNSLASFFRYCREQDETIRNPFAQVKRPRREPVKRPTLPDELVSQILAAALRNPYGWPGRAERDAAIISCMADAGLRRAEVPALFVADYIRIEGAAELQVVGKGQKLRVVPCPERLQRLLEGHLHYRLKHSSKGALFLTVHRKRFHPKAIPPILAMACKLAGVERIRCHQLRHFYATRLHRRGAELESLKDLLGHSQISTTALYLRSDSKRLRQVVGLLDDEEVQPPGQPKRTTE